MKVSGDCTLQLGGIELRVDPLVGGRITSLCCDGFELLSGQRVDSDNYGSTFWTSPQTDWGWPPPEAIDRRPYAFDVGADTLMLIGEPDRTLGVRVFKRFSVDRERRAFVLQYSVENVSATPRAYAPWEVTRVPPSGITFFAGGSPPTWLAHCPEALTGAGQKTFARDAGGMLAHATDGYLFVKAFESVAAHSQAPGEAAIEIYANRRYVELEIQGRYERIEAGEKVSWFVTWYLRKLPRGMAMTAGDERLLDFATQLARQ
jgi:hypothetical protein